MDYKTERRWREHPVRRLLNRAAEGDHVYSDEIDDVRLPVRERNALIQAMKTVQSRHEADQISQEIFEALPDHHETRIQYEERRARAGDAQALASVQAREDAHERLVDEVWNKARNSANPPTASAPRPKNTEEN
ncbi:hypothetical protein FHX37_1990 [Haloactinospora alba]|uniref:Uncharacterized protein n=1 Tax=Haloactinospora alba TaxID=405555 RepID=A0A543NJM1_9ACTN|nr:hypothetical protein [Haloactinospora alba]TQN32065.1 hypothetical protein FHX37_1990 [Haloactinospora alba]